VQWLAVIRDKIYAQEEDQGYLGATATDPWCLFLLVFCLS
jgi:hypothetical protein